jgi:hypothetical protein
MRPVKETSYCTSATSHSEWWTLMSYPLAAAVVVRLLAESGRCDERGDRVLYWVGHQIVQNLDRVRTY